MSLIAGSTSLYDGRPSLIARNPRTACEAQWKILQSWSAESGFTVRPIAKELFTLGDSALALPYPGVIDQLAITKRLSKVPEDYRTDTILAEAAKDLASRGVRLSPGEALQLILVETTAKDGVSKARAYPSYDGSLGYDVAAYIDLLRRAADAIFWIAGAHGSDAAPFRVE